MRNLACLLGQHDFIRAYSPGHLRLRCVECGHETKGLRGPTTHVEPPVVKARKLRKPKAARPVLAVVTKARRTA